MPRLATSADLDGVLRLAEAKVSSTWRSQSRDEQPLSILRGLTHSEPWPSEYDLFVTEDERALSGFLLLRKRLVRGLTGDRESVVVDFHSRLPSRQEQLLRRAAQAAQTYDSQFLTFEVSPQDTVVSELLESLGFGLESHKISVITAECRMPEGSPYEVRPVAAGDDFLIGVLNSTMLAHTLVTQREHDMSDLTFRSWSSIMEQANRVDEGSAGLVLTLEGALVGHLLLTLEDRLGYITDLALERAHWGGTAVRHLMRAGSTLLFDRGIPLFVGDVSAANRRALLVAQRALGFAVDSHRYGLKL